MYRKNIHSKKIVITVVVLFSFLNFFLTPSLFAAGKPMSATELLVKGRKNFDKKNYERAIEFLQRFVDENPYEIEMRDALFLLGRSYQEKENYLEALSYYNRLVSRFPHSQYRKKIYYYIGSSYFSLKIFTRTKKNLDKFIRENTRIELLPNEIAMSHILLARVAKKENHFLAALDEYELAYRIIKNYDTNLKKDKILMQEIFFQMGFIYARYTDKKILAYNFFHSAMEYGLKKDDELKFLLRDVSLFHIGEKQGLRDISISDIQVDGDDIWIATWNGGVYRYTRSLDKVERIRIPSWQTRSIFIEQDSVFVTTFDGIFVYNKKNNKIRRLSKDNSFFSLAQKIVKDDRYIYFSTLSEGVIRYDYIRDEIKVLDENSFVGTRQVYSIDANHKYLVFGTLNNGVVLLDKEKNEVHNISSQNFSEVKGNNIKAVLIDGRFLWIAEHLSGLYKYDIVQKKIVLHDSRFHFPGTLLKREKQIWVGLSGEGIAVLDEENNKELFNITALDGLTSNEVHILRVQDDHVWIGYLDFGIDVLYYPLE